jgi:UDP-N-acetylglucosamine--N-acetylmuramyl-(pentapeptide) pyrophosphoryl-undecaprenol N-acetylglucosamine transferase
MEEQLVPRAGYRLECLPGSGLSRSLSLAGIKKNVKAMQSVIAAINRCKQIIREFRPDVIVGTGGYASFPALYAGSRMGIPTCVHESNAVPGLTTKMLESRVDRMMVAFADSADHYKHPEKVEVLGMPVQKAFVELSREDARRMLKLDETPLVVSAFGSLGARDMNRVVARMFRLEQDKGFPFRHIHATGSNGWQWMPQLVKEQGVELENCPAIDMREYIYDMPVLMAAADVIISRAGASSCNEIAAVGTPCILIPSPNVTNNHQEKNARILADRGAATLLPEPECTAERLLAEVETLLFDSQKSGSMRKALGEMAVPDSALRICRIMEELTGM